MVPYCVRSARETEQQLLPQVDVSDFAASELDHRFYAIAFLQKADGVVLFEFVVVIIGIGAELQLLYQNDVLFFLASCCFFLSSY